MAQQYYRFADEQTAIDAEAWICSKATALGVGFKQKPEDVTERWAVPTAELDEDEVPTGKWLFPRVPAEILAGLDPQTVGQFMSQFGPEIITV